MEGETQKPKGQENQNSSNSKEEKGNKTIEQIKKKKFLTRPLRTYSDDVAKLVKNQQISTAKIVLAEQKKRLGQESQEQQSDKKTKRKVNKAFWAFLLIILGIIVIISALIFTEVGRGIVSVIPGVGNGQPQIVDNDRKLTILADNKTNPSIRNTIFELIEAQTELDPKSLVEIEISRKRIVNPETGSSGTQAISTSEFFQILESTATAELIRSFDPNYLFGVINVGKNEPFILFRTKDFDRSFAQMFVWEPLMYRDVNDIFYKSLGTNDFLENTPDAGVGIVAVATSTATSTESVLSEPTFDPREFVDIIILNKDARAIVDSEGRIRFYYSFIDNDHLLMAANVEVMRDIIHRLTTQKLIR